jgi:hypothetical protein
MQKIKAKIHNLREIRRQTIEAEKKLTPIARELLHQLYGIFPNDPEAEEFMKQVIEFVYTIGKVNPNE